MFIYVTVHRNYLKSLISRMNTDDLSRNTVFRPNDTVFRHNDVKQDIDIFVLF